MKTEQIGNLVLVLVLLTAIGGISYLYTGAGRAGDLVLSGEQIGNYVCIDALNNFFIKSAGIPQSELTEEHGREVCAESGTNTHPVVFFAIVS